MNIKTVSKIRLVYFLFLSYKNDICTGLIIHAQIKDNKYCFTCSFVKECGMIQTEQLLKREYKATEISGNFIEGLKTTSVYRITREADLLQRKVYRNLQQMY